MRYVRLWGVAVVHGKYPAVTSSCDVNIGLWLLLFTLAAKQYPTEGVQYVMQLKTLWPTDDWLGKHVVEHSTF